jgi:[ribosomal protein S18]-alanine N-acetyltransferase
VSMLSRLLTRHEEPADGRLQIVPMHRRHLREVLPIEARLPHAVVAHGVRERAAAGREREPPLRDRTPRPRAGRVRGSLVRVRSRRPQAHVTNIVVAASARRTGVASALMLELAERAIERGCVSWTLEVRASSTGAQELYRSFGFAPAGVRRRYYDNTEDAIVMWCHDIQSADYRARLDQIAVRFGLDRSSSGGPRMTRIRRP